MCKNNKSIPAIIFDADGVLFASEALHLEAWERAFSQLSNVRLPAEALAKMAGKHTRVIANSLAQYDPSLEPELLATTKRNHILNKLAKAPLIPGVEKFWQQLLQIGITIGVASNSPKGFIANQLANHGLAPSILLGLEDVAQPKPSPEIFLRTAKELKIPISQHPNIVIFEDSPHGIKAGLKAGMRVMGVATNHPPERLLKAGASGAIMDFRELAEVSPTALAHQIQMGLGFNR